jgi:hypothetical protein
VSLEVFPDLRRRCHVLVRVHVHVHVLLALSSSFELAVCKENKKSAATDYVTLVAAIVTTME